MLLLCLKVDAVNFPLCKIFHIVIKRFKVDDVTDFFEPGTQTFKQTVEELENMS